MLHYFAFGVPGMFLRMTGINARQTTCALKSLFTSVCLQRTSYFEGVNLTDPIYNQNGKGTFWSKNNPSIIFMRN